MSVTRHSIRLRLLGAMMVTSLAALLAGAVALVVYDLNRYSQSLADDLQTQAQILARSAAAALDFDDPAAGAETLAALRQRGDVLRALVLRTDGTVLAQYAREAAPAIPAPPGGSGIVADDGWIAIQQPVDGPQGRLGDVRLAIEHRWADRLGSYGWILLLALLVAGGTAFALATGFNARLAAPIVALSRAARRVVHDRDFEVRVERGRGDPGEIGDLVDAFNTMLRELGARAQRLQAANAELAAEAAERRAAEQALREADQRKDEFLATLAHELRNPLAPLRNALYLLSASPRPADHAQARAVMDRQVRQMVRLIDDLLDVSRLARGKLTLKRERVALAQVTRLALEAVQPLIDAKGHRLQCELPAQDVWLDGDPARLAQVLSNVLNNAAKYTEPGGEIRLCARTVGDGDGDGDGERLRIVVADNGVGIDAESLPHVFEMFTQVDTSPERMLGGLGVGLALSQRLVQMHGGSIRAASQGRGQGSEFTIELPLAPALETAPADAVGRYAPRSSRRVLVVDDNVDYALSLAQLLRSLGHSVEVAHSADEGERLLAASAPEVALLDIGLPGVDGYELARRLRARAGGRPLRLAAVTGWGQDKDRQAAIAVGFDRHFVKPVDPNELLRFIDESQPQGAGPRPRPSSS